MNEEKNIGYSEIDNSFYELLHETAQAICGKKNDIVLLQIRMTLARFLSSKDWDLTEEKASLMSKSFKDMASVDRIRSNFEEKDVYPTDAYWIPTNLFS